MSNQDDTDVPDETISGDQAAEIEAAEKAAAEAAEKAIEENSAPAMDGAAAAEEAARQMMRLAPLRFSAPNLIGGRIGSCDIGDRIRISDSAANDGDYLVRAVEDEWLVVTGRHVHDEPPNLHARISLINDDEG